MEPPEWTYIRGVSRARISSLKFTGKEPRIEDLRGSWDNYLREIEGKFANPSAGNLKIGHKMVRWFLGRTR